MKVILSVLCLKLFVNAFVFLLKSKKKKNISKNIVKLGVIFLVIKEKQFHYTIC